MGTADTGVCSAISLWQWNWWAPLPYPEGGFAWCDCSCITVHETYLDLTQQHEIGTTGAQEASNFRVHWNFAVLQEQPQTSKSWPTRTRWTLEDFVKKGKEVVFIPGVSERETLVWQWSCFICCLACLQLWGRHFVLWLRSSHCPCTIFRRGAGLTFHASNYLPNDCSSLLIFLRPYLRVLNHEAGTISLCCPLQTLPVSHLPSWTSWPSHTCAAHSCFPFFTYRMCLHNVNWH